MNPSCFAPFYLLVVLLLVASGFAQRPLTKLENCIFVPTPWADGDSFLIKTADGAEHTIRLYGADCVEWHVNDETDARRLREQRRYFGISEMGETAADSIELAKGFGQTAAVRTAQLMSNRFTLYTAFADARGDGKHPRIYGFIRLDDGRDLAGVLVEEGLARAFGVYRASPGGESKDEYQDAMRDLELQAAKRGNGIWRATNWEALPVERRQQRQEDADLRKGLGKPELSEDFMLDPNTAARDDLLKLPGVGEIMANRIIEARPFTKIDDLLDVPGIGPSTLEKLRPHLKIIDRRN